MLSQFRPPLRYHVLLWAVGLFVVVNTIVRIGLLFFEADPANFVPWRFVPVLAVGFVYDVAASTFLILPLALAALLFPNRPWGRRGYAVATYILLLAGIFALLFTAVGEALFWNEFSSRFNFIAVDYLIYTRETIGNIRQSYPVGLLLLAVAAITLVTFASISRRLWAAGVSDGGTWRQRFQASLVVFLLPVASFMALGDGLREALPTPSMRELAGNGYYEFARAFRNNDLDYHTFYVTMPERDALREMRDEFGEARSTSVFTDLNHPLERQVVANGPPRKMHIVLVTMESLGANFLESYGGEKGLTPNLDRLAKEGLMFSRLYATGTRTVRGLEALALSVPPTPGQAVLTRKNNKGFQTLGGVLKENGYEPIFIYGGYSYFDNMNDFFGGNGYTVVDRTSLNKSEISHETIWGVADEDLFGLVIREIDQRVAAGKMAFAHVMTTSNHRPFTYPSGRIDIASGSSRNGAVKYSDWAIGKFMRDAATHPWYKDTLFVFVADHTSHARGRTDLPPENYHIPCIVYAPGVVSPQTVDAVASQIDVGPTILALLNISYTSRFFGQDILTEGQSHQRALMANYLTVGHMEDGILVELSPKARARVLDAESGRDLPTGSPKIAPSIAETVAHYQMAADVFRGRSRLTKP